MTGTGACWTPPRPRPPTPPPGPEPLTHVGTGSVGRGPGKAAAWEPGQRWRPAARAQPVAVMFGRCSPPGFPPHPAIWAASRPGPEWTWRFLAGPCSSAAEALGSGVRTARGGRVPRPAWLVSTNEHIRPGSLGRPCGPACCSRRPQRLGVLPGPAAGLGYQPGTHHTRTGRSRRARHWPASQGGGAGQPTGLAPREGHGARRGCPHGAGAGPLHVADVTRNLGPWWRG